MRRERGWWEVWAEVRGRIFFDTFFGFCFVFRIFLFKILEYIFSSFSFFSLQVKGKRKQIARKTPGCMMM